jgi:hypothetical protein
VKFVPLDTSLQARRMHQSLNEGSQATVFELEISVNLFGGARYKY